MSDILNLQAMADKKQLATCSWPRIRKPTMLKRYFVPSDCW